MSSDPLDLREKLYGLSGFSEGEKTKPPGQKIMATAIKTQAEEATQTQEITATIPKYIKEEVITLPQES